MSGAQPARRAPKISAHRRHPVRACARLRVGLDAGKQVTQELMRRVSKGDVKYACKLTRSRTVIVLDHGGKEFAFVYSRAEKRIISFLAPDAPEIVGWQAAGAAKRRREAAQGVSVER